MNGLPDALPRAMLFDMDDTIFDHTGTCRVALGEVRDRTPLLARRPLREIHLEYLRLLDAIQPDIRSGRTSIDTARIARFRELARFCGGSMTSVEAKELSREYRASYQAHRRAVPGARAVLERLHGRTVIGVVTNNEVPEQEEKLDFLRLRQLVDVLVISAGVGCWKPDPRIFQIALERSGARPDEAVMFGDSWTSDVLGARGAGIRAVWFNRFGRTNPEPRVVPEITSLRGAQRVERVLANGPGKVPARAAPRATRA